MAGGTILAELVLTGDKSFRKAIKQSADELDDAGDEAIHLSGALGRAAEGMGDLRTASAGATGATAVLSGRLDETEDELSQVSRSAKSAAAGLGAYTGAAGAASTATVTWRTIMIASLIPAVGALLLTLGPLVAVLGGVAAAAGAVATAFGAVIGSGMLAFGRKLAKQNESRLETVQDNIAAIEALRDAGVELSEHTAERLEQLKEEEDRLEDATTAAGALGLRFTQLKEEIADIIAPLGEQFIPLIEDAFNAMPILVQRIVDSIGPLDTFADTLRGWGQVAMRSIPAATAVLFEFARKALPAVEAAMSAIAEHGPGVLQAIARASRQTADEWLQFGRAAAFLTGRLLTLGVTITEVVLPVISTLTFGFAKLIERFNNLPKPIREAAVAGGMMAATLIALVPLIRVVGAVLGILLSPLGLLITGIALFTAAWQSNLWNVRDVTRDVIGIVQTQLTLLQAELAILQTEVQTRLGVIEGFWDAHKATVLTVVPSYQQVRTQVTTALTTLQTEVQTRLGMIEGFWTTHKTAILTAIPSYQQVRTQVTTALTTLQTEVQTRLGAIEGFWNTHKTTVLTAIPSYQQVRTAITETLTQLQTIVGEKLTLINQHWTTARQAVLNILPTYQQVRTAVTTALGVIQEITGTVLGKIRGFWDTHGAAITAWGGKIKEKLLSAFQNLATGVQNLVGGKWSTAMSNFQQAGQDAVKAVRIALVGEDGNSGLIIEGIRTLGSWLTENGGPLIETGFGFIRDKATFALDEIRIFAVGEDGNSGIINTILDQAFAILNEHASGLWKEAWETLASVAEGALKNLKIAAIGEDGKSGIINNLIGGMATYMKGGGKTLVEQAANLLGGAIRGVFEELWKAIIGDDDSIIRNVVGGIVSYLKEDAKGDLETAWKIIFGPEGIFNSMAESFYGGLIGKDSASWREFTKSLRDFITGTMADELGDAWKDIFGTEKGATLFDISTSFVEWFITNDDSFMKTLVKDVKDYLIGAGLDLVEAGFKAIFGDEQGSAIFDLLTKFHDWLIGNSWFSDLFDAIKTWLESTGKEKATSGFETVVGAIEETLNGIDLSGINSAIEGVISAAQTAISKLNELRGKQNSTGDGGGGGGGSGGGGSGAVGEGGNTGGPGAGPDRNTGEGGNTGGPTPTPSGQHGAFVARGAGMMLLHGPELVLPLHRAVPFLSEALTDAAGRLGGGGGGDTEIDASLTVEEINVEGGEEDVAEKIRAELERFREEQKRHLNRHVTRH